VILSLVLFAVVFLITGLVALLLTASLEPAGLIGGVCGFAAAWLIYAAYIVGRRRAGEDRGEAGEEESDTDRHGA
jgi:threonine/homoserine efflux transporter RhtA